MHLFWFFGHPSRFTSSSCLACGLISHVVSAFARKPVFVLDRDGLRHGVPIGVLGLIVWAHFICGGHRRPRRRIGLPRLFRGGHDDGAPHRDAVDGTMWAGSLDPDAAITSR